MGLYGLGRTLLFFCLQNKDLLVVNCCCCTTEHNFILSVSYSMCVCGRRQEKLEQLAARFDRKAGMREVWLSENQRLVAQDNFGFDLAAVEAAVKKHEAIETDINAYEERVQAVVSVAQELDTEKYHDIDRINARKDNVLRLWQYLLELLKARRMRLGHTHDLQKVFMVNRLF